MKCKCQERNDAKDGVYVPYAWSALAHTHTHFHSRVINARYNGTLWNVHLYGTRRGNCVSANKICIRTGGIQSTPEFICESIVIVEETKIQIYNIARNDRETQNERNSISHTHEGEGIVCRVLPPKPSAPHIHTCCVWMQNGGLAAARTTNATHFRYQKCTQGEMK